MPVIGHYKKQDKVAQVCILCITRIFFFKKQNLNFFCYYKKVDATLTIPEVCGVVTRICKTV